MIFNVGHNNYAVWQDYFQEKTKKCRKPININEI